MTSKNYIYTGLIVIALLALMPIVAPSYWIAFAFFCFIYVAICEMWTMVTGFSGMVLLGIYGFVGLGAYALVIFSTCLNLPLLLSIPLSGIVGAILALVIAPSIFRMRGLYFAMCSLVVAEAVSAWFKTWSYTGGGAGISIRANVSIASLYYLALLLAVVSVVIVWKITQSRLGLMLRAIGDDEDAAQTVGVNTFVVKLYCMLIASFIISMTGAVYFLYPLFVTPSAGFSSTWLVNSITASAIGGSRSIEGAILGVVIVVALQQFFFVNYPGLSMLIEGLTILVVFTLIPEGIWPRIRSIFEKKLK